jgi:hypothetical protein
MAFSEVERVALYWSKSAIRSLRQEPAVRLMLACEKPSAHVAEILDGCCLLYRVDRSPIVKR